MPKREGKAFDKAYEIWLQSPWLTTEQVAKRIGIQPNSLRVAAHREGENITEMRNEIIRDVVTDLRNTKEGASA